MQLEYKGYPVWTHNEFKATLRSAFLAQMEGKGPQSVLVLGDHNIGKTTCIQEFCSEMAEELCLAKAPQKYGQERGYINLFDIGQRAYGRPIDEFESLLKEDASKAFAYLEMDLISLSNWPEKIRFFENPESIGVLVLDFGMDYYNKDKQGTQRAIVSQEELYLSQLIADHLWKKTQKISDNVLIIATGITSYEDLSTDIGNEFKSNGLLYLTPESWYKHAELQNVDARIIDFIKTNPFRHLGLERLLNDHGQIATDEELASWIKGEKTFTFNERRNLLQHPCPGQVTMFGKEFIIYRNQWEFNDGDGDNPREISDNYYEWIGLFAAAVLGTSWANAFMDYLYTIGDGKEFDS